MRDLIDPDLEPPRRQRRFRRVPFRIIVPNLVTLIALALGLTSIRVAAEGDYASAVLAILAAAILDGLDGRIARVLRGTTRFGAELDSLADFVDFGVAPGLLLYFWNFHEMRSFGWFAAMVFAIACALRLARFNVMMEDPEKPAWSGHFFVGMPAPAGAIVSLLPLYLNLSVVGLPRLHAWVPFEIAYVLSIAFLMISPIPHFSGKKIDRVPREWFIPVLFGIVVTILLLATFTMEMLVALSLLYLALIPLSVRRYRAFQRADATAAAASAQRAAPASAAEEAAR